MNRLHSRHFKQIPQKLAYTKTAENPSRRDKLMKFEMVGQRWMTKRSKLRRMLLMIRLAIYFWLFLILFGVGSLFSLAQQATPTTSITIRKGFKVELIHSATKEEGSWISMTFDDKGRLICGRDSNGFVRIELPKNERPIQVEILKNDKYRHCRGLLFAHDSLWVSATNTKALYRLTDTNGDGKFDKERELTKVDYNSRYGHGTNQIVLGPDKLIYFVNGNDIKFPPNVNPQSAYRDPRPDQLVSNPRDANQDDRVGHIIQFNPKSENWNVVAGGFRNQFDMAFNADGEMFTYDADMEWDVGLPWYRPTRINHVISAGEYGWKWGTGKWPEYYIDSLPSSHDLGLGSPTGILFGTKSRFPSEYRRAMFLADWQNGRIYVARILPQHSTYRFETEIFVEGGPLNVCDMEFGPDGNLYFITGGRGSQTGLYRVKFLKNASHDFKNPELPKAEVSLARASRKTRRELEKLHLKPDDSKLDFIWRNLAHADRWIRFSARVALERLPNSKWQKRIATDENIQRKILACLALARREAKGGVQGQDSNHPLIFEELSKLDLKELSRGELLSALRVYQVALSRFGMPNSKIATDLGSRFNSVFPNSDNRANRELCELLVYLQNNASTSNNVLSKSLKLMNSPQSGQEDQIQFAHLIVRLKHGWDERTRLEFAKWFLSTKRFRGGKLMVETVKNMLADFENSVKAIDKIANKEIFSTIAAAKKQDAVENAHVNRKFVADWKFEQLSKSITKLARGGRSFTNGQKALAVANCLHCHQMGNLGSNIGPDLTNVGKRYNSQAILESIVRPSKVIDPKYRFTGYELITGETHIGRPTRVVAKEIDVETNPISRKTVTIKRADIESAFPARTSPMPEGLLNVLEEDEILDLIAYLASDGDPEHKLFRKNR